jgi:uncharacterized protein (DUF58 family)
MDTLKTIEEAGEKLIATIRTVEDWAATLAETVGQPIARLVPVPPLPESLHAPRAREFAESTFGLWERLAKAQNEFTLRVLDAFDPLAHRTEEQQHAEVV